MIGGDEEDIVDRQYPLEWRFRDVSCIVNALRRCSNLVQLTIHVVAEEANGAHCHGTLIYSNR